MSETFDEMVNGSTQVPAPPVPVPAPKAVTDLSPRVVQLARVIDRLPPGTFEIELTKGEVKAMDWKVEIVDPMAAQPVQHLTLSKYNPE